ncbi:uncharacterized protein C8Q71DRAFT_730835 [Rhodofomes roseus]|uniref:Uncharacterized protein n=1 Tax=Rhodofomes roseus TaxID=34475 RepID=A0ABQ8KXL8_9APHY|nr:uncharacterized protein C8Q71DRAFT_730835 [Rhodofomes roseus]KAH9843986.1 hypothetical protein C8Q71DRAFT_730835 [Rhodofomes roseus]
MLARCAVARHNEGSFPSGATFVVGIDHSGFARNRIERPLCAVVGPVVRWTFERLTVVGRIEHENNGQCHRRPKTARSLAFESHAAAAQRLLSYGASSIPFLTAFASNVHGNNTYILGNQLSVRARIRVARESGEVQRGYQIRRPGSAPVGTSCSVTGLCVWGRALCNADKDSLTVIDKASAYVACTLLYLIDVALTPEEGVNNEKGRKRTVLPRLGSQSLLSRGRPAMACLRPGVGHA